MTLLAGVVDPLPFALQLDGNISPDADCARVFRPTHGSQTNGFLQKCANLALHFLSPRVQTASLAVDCACLYMWQTPQSTIRSWCRGGGFNQLIEFYLLKIILGKACDETRKQLVLKARLFKPETCVSSLNCLYDLAMQSSSTRG